MRRLEEFIQNPAVSHMSYVDAATVLGLGPAAASKRYTRAVGCIGAILAELPGGVDGALETAPDDAEGFRRTVAGTWRALLGRSISRSDSSIKAIGTIASPSALTEDHLRRVTFHIPIRTRHQSTSGTLPRGESSPRSPGAFGPFAFQPDGKVLVAHTDEQHILAIDLVTGRVALDELGVAWS